jgi:hypothetical protein
MITQNQTPVGPPPPGVGASNSVITYLSDTDCAWQGWDYDGRTGCVWERTSLLMRAYCAYHRRPSRAHQQSGSSAVEWRSPTPDKSFTQWHHNVIYVVIGDYEGPCAVYRLDNRDKLKRLKRWPKEIDEAFAD